MKRRFGIVLAAAVALGLSLPTAAAQAAPVAVSPNYLAAGDSITTGLGVSSAQAFPSRLDAASRKLTLANVATPGAGLAAVGAQLALYPGDKEAVTKITLTVGANDIQWVDILLACLNQPVGSPCAQRVVAPPATTVQNLVDAGFVGLPAGVQTLLAGAHQAYPNARIHVAGYYELFGSHKRTCQLGNGYFITAADKAWYNATILRLNSVLKGAVAATNASVPGSPITYVSVASRFNGHGLCDSATPWVIGSENLGAAGHPTAKGQQAYANALFAAGVR
ncbi:MAG: GDSL-type esterase/lipase family protein [Propionicimonas sp.]